MFFLCRTSSRPSGSVPSAPSTSLFAETSLGVSLPGSSSSSSSLPLGGQGKRGGGLGVHLVFVVRCFLPSRSTLVWRGGRECLWAFVCRVRARSFFSSSFGRWGRGSWLSCCRRPFPASPSLLTLPNSHRTFHDVRIRGSLQSLAPAFYPPASHALQSVARGWIRGLGHVRLALVDVAVALALSPLTVRGYGVVSVGGGHRPRHAFLVVAHAVGGRGLLTATAPAVSVRVSHACRGVRRDRSRSRALPNRSRDCSRRGRSRSFDRYRSRRERARFPCLSGGAARSFAIARSPESLAWPLAVKRAITCFSCPLAVRGSRTAGQTWALGGCGGLCLSASCGLEQRRVSFLFWRGVHCRSPVCFCGSLPSSSWACLAPLPWEHLESWRV